MARISLCLVLLLLGACGSRPADVTDGAPAEDTSVLGDNTTCAKADPITLFSGSASISGSTATSTNEYGTQVNCGSNYTLMRGPQRYYTIRLSKGQNYKLTLTPQFSSARLYVFGACGPSKINTDCGSRGALGDVSSSVSKGSARTLFFSPPKDGLYYLAVDSTSSSDSGKGDYLLTVDEHKPADNERCAKAKTLTLSGGKVKVQGSTEGAANEFGTGINCGTSYGSFPGSQVYYRVALTGGRSYLVSFTPQYSLARFYIFRTTCTVSAINTDCGSDGKTGDVGSTGSSGKTSLISFTPASSGTYTIAVDSTSANYSGQFELAIEEFKTPANSKCTAAQQVTVGSSQVTLKGSTFGGKNEFGEQITCGSTAADGPQVYYRLGLTAGKTYKLDLQPDFSAKLYLFGDTCDPVKIDTDCASKGATGAYTYAYTTSSQPLYFKASNATYKLAVDSSGDSYYGNFTLTIEEFTPAPNGACSAAKAVTLTSGATTTISGDTSGVANEFGTAVNCGNYSAILVGNQVYYALALTAGSSYTFTLTPDYSSARFYLFGTACDAGSINTDCASKGQSGFVSDYVSKGTTKSVSFKPTSSGTYTLAVDGTSTSYFGSFKLEITAP